MLERAKLLKALPLPTKIAILDYFERMNREFLEANSQLFWRATQNPDMATAAAGS